MINGLLHTKVLQALSISKILIFFNIEPSDKSKYERIMKRIIKYAIVILSWLFLSMPVHAQSEKYVKLAPVQNRQTISFADTKNFTTPQISNNQADKEAIRDKLLGEWRNLWSTGDKNFTFKGYEKLFLDNDQFLASDALSPSETLIRGWKAYTELWEPYTNQHLHPWTITRLDVNNISVAGDMAWSSVNLYGEGMEDGEKYLGSEHCTHVWRKIDGQWRIVHEHVSGPINL